MKIYEYIVIIIYILLITTLLLTIQGMIDLSIEQIIIIGVVGLLLPISNSNRENTLNLELVATFYLIFIAVYYMI